MTGYPEFNYPKFRAVASELRAAGHEVYNPAEYPWNGPGEVFPARRAFASYALFICLEACSIVLLPGWETSLGVSAELALARNCNLDVLKYPGDFL